MAVKTPKVAFNTQYSSGVVSQLLCRSRKKKPYLPHGKSLEIPRGKGLSIAKILEAKYEAKLESLGGGGVQNRKTFCGGSKEIFWN